MFSLKKGLSKSLSSSIAIMVFVSIVGIVSAQETITIRWGHPANATMEGWATEIEAAFEAAHPEINVEREPVTGAYVDGMVTRLAAGVAPDVLEIPMIVAASMADRGFLLDINPYVERTPEYRVEEIAPVGLFTYTSEGKLIAAPRTLASTGFVYNADLFQQAGLEDPGAQYARGRWTWDDFRDSALKLTRRNPDRSFDVIGSNLHRYRPWIWSNGSDEWDDPRKPSKAMYDVAETLESLEFLNELVREDEVMVTRTNDVIGIADSPAFLAGKLAMQGVYTSYLAQLIDTPFDIGIVPVPKSNGPSGAYGSDADLWGSAINAASDKKDAAWKFLSFATGPNGYAQLNLPGLFPARRPAVLDWFPENFKNPEVIQDLLEMGRVRIVSKDALELYLMVDPIVNRIWKGELSPNAASQEVQRVTDAFLSQNPQ